MTDLSDLIATLEQMEQDRMARGTTSSDEVRELLKSATSHLEATRVNGNGQGGAHPIEPADDLSYEEIRQSLDKVRRIVTDLREGRY